MRLQIRRILKRPIYHSAIWPVLWLMTISIYCQPVLAVQSQKTESKTITLRGVVVGPDGKAVSEPVIKLHQTERGWAKDIRPRLKITSNQDGTFVVQGLKSGCHPIFTITDSENKLIEMLVLDQSDKSKLHGDIADLKISLHKGATIKGKVLDDNNPASNAKVAMNISRGRSVAKDRLITYEMQSQFQGQTDDKGEYLFENVLPEVEVVIVARVGNNEWLFSNSFKPKPGEERFVKDIKFETFTGKISGTVVDTKGRPIKGVSIDIHGPNHRRFKADEQPGTHESLGISSGRSKRVSGKDGGFSASKLPPGKLSLRAHPSGRVKFKKSAHVEVVTGETDIRIVLDDRLGREVKKRK